MLFNNILLCAHLPSSIFRTGFSVISLYRGKDVRNGKVGKVKARKTKKGEGNGQVSEDTSESGKLGHDYSFLSLREFYFCNCE